MAHELSQERGIEVRTPMFGPQYCTSADRPAVVLAMSGGVDSSVTAKLLSEKVRASFD